MKKQILLILILSTTAWMNAQTVHLIQNSGTTFAPNAIEGVMIGDTIKWQWTSGSHTTTSTTIPDGAVGWDSPLNSANQVFKYVVQIAGVYNYKCTPHESMGMIGSFTVMDAAGINQYPALELKVSPNPAHDFITIDFPGTEKGYSKLTIYDLLGKSVYSGDLELNGNETSFPLDFSALNPGIYLIIMNSKGNAFKPVRIIKQ